MTTRPPASSITETPRGIHIENNFGFYAQDNFRVTPRLTFNYGLRWDYFGVVQEKNNLLSNITDLDAVNDTFTLTQVGQPGLSSLYNPDKKDFAPRVSARMGRDWKGKDRGARRFRPVLRCFLAGYGDGPSALFALL